jgi:tRNA(Ile)-lysidine synthase
LLVETARARAAEVVAVGHTRDDQAETILHRIVRGTGPHGLAGMLQVRVLSRDPRIALVRPLLDVPRRAIREHLGALGQPFREDETNADLTRTRSRIRHDLLPKLAADYNPRVVEALVRLARLAAASRRAIEADVRTMTDASTITVAPDCVVLKHPFLSSLPSHLRAEVLRRVWRQVGWPEGEMSARRWRRLSALVQQREVSRVEIGAGVAVSTERFFLVLRRSPVPRTAAPAVESRGPIALEVPGAAAVPWAGGRVVATIDPAQPSDESIDRDRLALPLSIRPPLPGDRFEPLGMGGRSTPLADFFRGRHIPRDRRDRTPLVCDQLGIVWVVGHRITDRVKVTEQTRQTLGLRWEALP